MKTRVAATLDELLDKTLHHLGETNGWKFALLPPDSDTIPQLASITKCRVRCEDDAHSCDFRIIVKHAPRQDPLASFDNWEWSNVATDPLIAGFISKLQVEIARRLSGSA